MMDKIVWSNLRTVVKCIPNKSINADHLTKPKVNIIMNFEQTSKFINMSFGLLPCLIIFIAIKNIEYLITVL